LAKHLKIEEMIWDGKADVVGGDIDVLKIVWESRTPFLEGVFSLQLVRFGLTLEVGLSEIIFYVGNNYAITR